MYLLPSINMYQHMTSWILSLPIHSPFTQTPVEFFKKQIPDIIIVSINTSVCITKKKGLLKHHNCSIIFVPGTIINNFLTSCNV